MEGVHKVFRWTEAYSVRVAVLDQQHQGLLTTVDELNQAMAAGKGNEVLVTVLRKLVDHAVIHFAAEESLMEEHDFPGFSTHRAEHEMFRKKIAAFLEDHKGGKRGVPVTLMFFLQGWLKDHMQHADQLYSGFLNARGVH